MLSREIAVALTHALLRCAGEGTETTGMSPEMTSPHSVTEIQESNKLHPAEP